MHFYIFDVFSFSDTPFDAPHNVELPKIEEK